LKASTKNESIHHIASIPSTFTVTTSNYAGVSFSGDILYNESSERNRVRFSGQGIIYASQDGSIHAVAVPDDPFKNASTADGQDSNCAIPTRRRSYVGITSSSEVHDGSSSPRKLSTGGSSVASIDIYENIVTARANSTTDVISAIRSYSSSSVSRDSTPKDDSILIDSWRVAGHPGNNAEVRVILVSLSPTAHYSYQPEPEMPHIFSAESSWQISTGDMKGHVTIHRGTGALLAPSVLNSKLSIKSASVGYNQPQIDGFASSTVQSQSTQLVGVGGISSMCSVACVQRQRGSVGSAESLSCLSERLCLGTYKGHVLVVDVGSGQPIFRAKSHSPSGVCAVTAIRSSEFVSAGFDGSVKLWDIRSSGPTSSLKMGRAAVTCLQIGADDNYIYAGYANGEVCMWDLRYDAVNPAVVMNGHADRITGLALHVSGC